MNKEVSQNEQDYIRHFCEKNNNLTLEQQSKELHRSVSCVAKYKSKNQEPFWLECANINCSDKFIRFSNKQYCCYDCRPVQVWKKKPKIKADRDEITKRYNMKLKLIWISHDS